MKHLFLKKSTAIKLSTILLASSLISGCNSNEKSYAEYIDESKTYLANKEFKSAEISLKNAIQQSPDTAESRYLLGQLYLDTGNMPIAAVELRRAVQLGANNPETFTSLGVALLQTGDIDTLIDKFGVLPDDSDTLKAIKKSFSGDALLSKRQVDSAKVMYDQALQFDSDNVRAQLGLAKVSVVNNQLDLAFEKVDKTISEHKSSPSAWITKADLYRIQKNSDDTIASFEKALSLSEEESPELAYVAVRNLSYEYLHAMDLAKAEAILKKLPKEYRRQSNSDPMINYVKAFIAFDEKDISKAKEYAEKVQPTSKFPFILLLLGNLNLQENNLEQAEAQLESFTRLYPQHPTGNKLLAMTQIKRNNLESASKTLTGIVDRSGASADTSTIALLANVNLRSGNAEKSERYFKMALEKQPDNESFKFGLAQSYFLQSNNDEAISELEAIPADSKNRILAILAIAEAFARERKFDEAIKEVEKLPEDLAENVIVPSFKGTIYLFDQQLELAEDYFKKALTIKPDYIPAIRQLAYVDSIKGDAKTMLDRLSQANNTIPNNYPLTIDYAKALYQVGDTDKATTELHKAIELRPQSDDARLLLSKIELANQKPVAAIAQLNAMHNANSVEAQTLLGKSRFMMGEYLTALDSFKKAYELAPSANTALLIFETYRKSGQTIQAKEYLNRQKENHSDSEVFLLVAINEAIRANDSKEASTLLTTLAALAPQSLALHPLQAKVLSTEPYEVAEQSLKKAFSETENIAYANALITIYNRNNQLAKAIDFTKTQLATNKQADFFYTALGSLYLNSQDNQNALITYEQALNANPDNIIALNNSAWLLKDSDNEKAKALINRALKLAPENADILDTAKEVGL